MIGGDHKSGNAFVGGSPICHDSWGLDEANVFCKDVGFRRAITYTKRSK